MLGDPKDKGWQILIDEINSLETKPKPRKKKTVKPEQKTEPQNTQSTDYEIEKLDWDFHIECYNNRFERHGFKKGTELYFKKFDNISDFNDGDFLCLIYKDGGYIIGFGYNIPHSIGIEQSITHFIPKKKIKNSALLVYPPLVNDN